MNYWKGQKDFWSSNLYIFLYFLFIDIKEKTTQNDKIKVKQKGRNQRQNKPQDDDDDDCSKVKMVGQMKKQTNEAVAYTIESLKKKLSEKNDMSKNQRKRLKKKLHNLQKDKEENGYLYTKLYY